MSIYQHITLKTVESTNIYARDLAVKNLPAVITAKLQTKGRGRNGRDWVCYEGNLVCSFVLLAEKSDDVLGQLSFVMALAVANSIGGDVTLKWPNDVLLTGKKVAGILLEKHNDRIIIGVGVNVVQAPDFAQYPATSLCAAGIKDSAEMLLDRLKGEFERLYQVWLNDFAIIRSAWLEKCAHMQTNIKVTTLQDSYYGQFKGLLDTGELLLTQSDGKDRVINVGDVYF